MTFLKNEKRSCNHCWSGKAISITQLACVFAALFIQHAIRVRHIVICDLSSSTVLFPTLSHKRHDFRKKKLLKIKCVFRISLRLSEIYFILRRTEQDIIENLY